MHDDSVLDFAEMVGLEHPMFAFLIWVGLAEKALEEVS